MCLCVVKFLLTMNWCEMRKINVSFIHLFFYIFQSRVVSQNQNERNFHIFYQMCFGADNRLKGEAEFLPHWLHVTITCYCYTLLLNVTVTFYCYTILLTVTCYCYMLLLHVIVTVLCYGYMLLLHVTATHYC